MKGFIKITDVSEKEHYINISYIIKFSPITGSSKGNTSIRIVGGDNTTSIQTSTTCEEIVDMIDLASK